MLLISRFISYAFILVARGHSCATSLTASNISWFEPEYTTSVYCCMLRSLLVQGQPSQRGRLLSSKSVSNQSYSRKPLAGTRTFLNLLWHLLISFSGSCSERDAGVLPVSGGSQGSRPRAERSPCSSGQSGFAAAGSHHPQAGTRSPRFKSRP